MTVSINMPQMAAGGLSENWLFKFSGDLHWQALCASMETSSRLLVSDAGDRLYASFIAISARYSAPIAAVQENDVLQEAARLSRYGSSFFHGHVTLDGAAASLKLELLTAFVSRETAEGNDLRRAVPATHFTYHGETEGEPPALLSRSAQLRKSIATTHAIDAFELALDAPRLGLEVPYSPSPYVDYNGANLLYYAAYPTICDAGERRIAIANRLVPEVDREWALATSTLARDVFYYGNLDLGEDLLVRLEHLVRDGDRLLFHTFLLRATDRLPIAELFTVKAIIK